MINRINVLVAYRHTLLRQALRTVLIAERDMGDVYEAADGKAAVDLAERVQPDVVLMDAQLPIVSGVEATQLIKKRSRDTRVLLLTLGADDETVMDMLRAGASGCVLKDSDTAELLNAVRVAHRGGSYLSPKLEERLVQNYVRQSRNMTTNRSPKESLSVREREVLQLVAEGVGNQAIAKRLVVSVKTVEAHKANIARKLGVRGKTELIKYAIRKGLIDLEMEVGGRQDAEERETTAVG